MTKPVEVLSFAKFCSINASTIPVSKSEHEQNFVVQVYKVSWFVLSRMYIVK